MPTIISAIGLKRPITLVKRQKQLLIGMEDPYTSLCLQLILIQGYNPLLSQNLTTRLETKYASVDPVR